MGKVVRKPRSSHRDLQGSDASQYATDMPLLKKVPYKKEIDRSVEYKQVLVFLTLIRSN